MKKSAIKLAKENALASFKIEKENFENNNLTEIRTYKEMEEYHDALHDKIISRCLGIEGNRDDKKQNEKMNEFEILYYKTLEKEYNRLTNKK